MKKLVRGLIAIFLVFSLFTLSGCTLISVNPQRDNAQVIATIDGKDLYKSAFNNSLALVQMNYESGGQQWPVGSELKTLKEGVYDSLLQQNVYALQADKDKAKIDEKEAKTNVNETLNQLREELGEDQFESILEQNYTDNDQFEKWLYDNEIQSEKSSKTSEKFEDDFKKDPKTVLDQTVGKINDTDVKRGEYQYFLLLKRIDYVQQNQSPMPSDKATMEDTNEEIFEEIEKINANIKYAEDNDIKISKDAIESAKKSIESQYSTYLGGDQKESTLSGAYLTEDAYNEYLEKQAKGQAAEEAIQKQCEDNAKVIDQEIEKYYRDNEKKYDTTEVSAMHILAEEGNDDAAQSIYEEAKDITTKEDFQKLIDKYKDVEGITEASDLGSFDYSKMVPEFADAAFNADVNTVVGPVQTTYGKHVIFVYDRKEGEVKPLEEVKDEIETTLKQEKGQEEFDKVEEDLTSGVHYDIPDEIKTPTEEYTDKLETEYDVKKHESALRL